jgi:carbon storage regulator
MLVLSRRRGETIQIGGGIIEITVLGVREGTVKIGINAPKDIAVHRSEIQARIENAPGSLTTADQL